MEINEARILFNCLCELNEQDLVLFTYNNSSRVYEAFKLIHEQNDDAISRFDLRTKYEHLVEICEGMSEQEIHDAEIYKRIIHDIDNASSINGSYPEYN